MKVTTRDIEALAPKVAAAARLALADCAAKGLGVLITCTFRSAADQDALYAQGRTKPGRIVTNAKGGQSFHQFACALDLVPIVNGKPDWNGADPIWHEIAAVFKARGFEWGYEWKRFKEMPHFQMTFSHPLSYFQQGGTI